MLTNNDFFLKEKRVTKKWPKKQGTMEKNQIEYKLKNINDEI